MRIGRAPELAEVKLLLRANALPTADVDSLDNNNFLYCGNNENPSGVVGLEVVGEHALLRSLVVAQHARNKGCARALVAAIEELALERKLLGLYLLTETEQSFFAQLDYLVVERVNAPKGIKRTPEFSGLCSASAVLMFKPLEYGSTAL